MFGLDDKIASLGTGEAFLVVAAIADPARPAPRHRPRPPDGGHDADRRRRPPRPPQGALARLRLGPRPRNDPVRLRPADRPREGLPAGGRPARRRDRGRHPDHRAGGPAADPLAPRRVPRRTGPRHATAARRSRRTASASCTAWAARPASACCCWPRSPTAPRRSSRWRCSRLHRGIDGDRVEHVRLRALARAGAAPVRALAPALGALSLAFGVWYSLGALNAVPYVF